MDPERFDALALSISQFARHTTSRRVVLAVLGGLAAGELTGMPTVEARRRRQRVRDRVRRRRDQRGNKVASCPTGQLLCNGQCAGCCADADCGGNACQDGLCADCPRGQRPCRGGCIAEGACCVDGDCTGGHICIDGSCACRATERLCQGACIPSDECCGTDCPPPPTCAPETCGGCCDSTTCRQGDSQNFCGRNGAACIQCPPRLSCDAGQCVCDKECCADADCFAGTNGLCRPDGRCAYEPDCLPRNTQLSECTAQSQEPCCSGVCIFGQNICAGGAPGAPCHTDSDCDHGRCTFYVCE